ncbi:tetratricopeptide repeat-containing sensor histidine kinase [Polaribacter porphyrae]|uniref:histidine kinase n=1 Tax=Polaribacter porphyrae TaxID=1137780 RepID=A0A2S7WK43_9FLAO|nr:hypothetical protein [Polaribacter porphyrae]PQJ77987.1 hypothetical protein BTO18_01750 [Polaribacter porphyrae]
MKQIKVTFLFFLIVIFFVSCKDKSSNNNASVKDEKLKELYQKSVSKKTDFSNRLNFSKEILGQKNVNDTIRYLVLNNISYLYGKLNKIDSSIIFAKKMLNQNIVKKNYGYKGKVYYKLGGYFNKKSQSDSAFYYFNQSKISFLKDSDSIQVGRSLLNIAIIESNFGSYSISDSTAVEAIKFINGKRNRTTSSAYNCLAINSKKRFLFDDAITYYKKAFIISDNENSKIKYKNNLAILYKDKQQYQKSILLFEELLKNSKINKKTRARVLDNLAYTKWLQNRNKKVLKDLFFANSLKLKNNDNYGLIASYSHLAEFFEKRNKNKSLLYIKKMYQAAKNEKAVNSLLESIDKIVKLQTPEKSIKYYKESICLRDSLQQENTKRQYKFAKIKYDYEEEEKKKLKFKTLATENKLIAEQENNQKKNILIIAIISISILSFSLYRRKQIQKKKVLEEKYLTETRIAKKLHDELGNDIFNVITKVQNTTYSNTEIVNDLDKIYLQTRAISHENDEIVTGKDFEKTLNQLIESYHSEDCKIILKDISALELNFLKKEQQRMLYRVFNELLVNLKKHSKANLVVISCKKEGKFLEINYADNGVGFKNNEVVLKNGLTNMETRIKPFGGTLNFESVTNKGLKIKIRFKK